jgi:antitoxin (DNA-binding transcriptional repressor) of toxin-antitoxin stability system
VNLPLASGDTVTLDAGTCSVTIVPMPPTEISIKELHGATGEIVRRAGASRIPLVITDRGEPVAILANPNVISQVRHRQNSLLPEFTEFLERGRRTDVQSDLDDVRGDR